MDAVEFAEQTRREIEEAVKSGLDANECTECEGLGQLECGNSTNDPDARTYVDDCPKCDGSGNGFCPFCDEPAAYLVKGDGRCEECILEQLLELVDDEEIEMAMPDLVDGAQVTA